MTLHLHRILALMPLALLAASCVEPPLYLRKNIQTYVVIEPEIDLTVYWQADWQLRWTFPWNEEIYGPIGYTAPKSMRMHSYQLNVKGEPMSHNVNTFHGTSSIVPMMVGVYDLLFHNVDSEVLLFSESEVMEEIYCSTRILSPGLKESHPVMTTSQKADTKSETNTPDAEPVALMPDALYTLYDQSREISEDLSNYEYIDGRYILRLEGELSPESYIYLIQIKLLNNHERVVGSEGGAAITGVARGVDIRSRFTSDSTVSVPMTVLMDRENDLLGARVMTFGIPGCNPYDTESVSESESEHFLVVNICYSEGSWKNIRIDITEAFRSLPLGGVINLELDVNDFPPDGAHSGSGFLAIIDNWDDIKGGMTIIN